MAQFGAKRPIFAPTKTTPDNALPTYDYEKVVTVGKLVKADLTVANASGEIYADDALAEKVDMFASGSLALETDDKTDEVHVAIHGATKDTESSEVTDSDGDVAPRGGLCYYKVIIRGGVRYFKGVFHPLVKAILGNDSAATKGSSITFGTSATTFSPMANITREQMMTMFYGYAVYMNYNTMAVADLSVFPDSGDVSYWAEAKLGWGVANALIKGVQESDGVYLRPRATATRAEAAAILRSFDQWRAYAVAPGN